MHLFRQESNKEHDSLPIADPTCRSAKVHSRICFRDTCCLSQSRQDLRQRLAFRRQSIASFRNFLFPIRSIRSIPVDAFRHLPSIREAKIELAELPIWYDVDDSNTLDLLREELLGGVAPPFANVPGYHAPHSREFLHRLVGVSQ